jgi:subtilisin family serine protease
VEILAFKSCWQVRAGQPDLCNTLTLAAGLDLAMAHDARIINLSLTGPADPLLSRLVATALTRGIVVVGPAGGPANDQGSFPSDVDGVLAVRHVDDPDLRTDGRYVAAPGRDVLTLVPGGRFDYVSGVSFATAMVSGVVALILERELMAPRAVASLLAMTAGPAGAPGAGASVDACRALAQLAGAPACGSPISVVGQH